MNDVKTRAVPTPSYEADFHAWTRDQAARLRESRPNAIDWENVAEEVESLGRSDKRAIESDLTVILQHMLKWLYQPEARKPGWKSTIYAHRRRIAKTVRESPSLRRYPAEVLAEEYEAARAGASDETDLPADRFPEVCPFTIEQVIDTGFYPDAPPA
jgi:hypothetical protein